ncbi:MAG: hypothetical protein LKF00_05790 [Olsenella sp.]|nr:hypothetical protein [Olsenella sp.]
MSSYSFPGTRFWYSTVSVMVTSSSAAASWEPSSASAAVVPIFGNRTVCPLVVDVGVRGHRLPALAELLERHDGVAGEPGRVELEGDLCLARGELGGEPCGGSDGLAVRAGHGLAGLAVHEGARELVLLPRHEVLVLDLVGELDVLGGLGQVLSALAGEGRWLCAGPGRRRRCRGPRWWRRA